MAQSKATMSSAHEPLPQYDFDSRLPTPGSAKSRFRSLFHWRTPSTNSLRPNTRAGLESDPPESIPNNSLLRPPMTSRSRSDNPNLLSVRLHSSGGPRMKKQDKIIADPPPMAQTQGQAVLHTLIETPTSYADKRLSRRPSFGSGEDAYREATEETVEVKRSHRKTDSGESTCTTAPKAFFLIPGPYLLQYSGDAEGDALPEKILALDRDCVAFASDAVPGKRWVLQVSKTSNSPVKAQGQTLRPSWSRLTLRQAEDKRTVNTMLLIFYDSDELYTWLYAIRKDIEHLGGLEYRPNTDEDDQSWRDNLTRRFAAESRSRSCSRKSSASRTLSPLTSPVEGTGKPTMTVGQGARTRSSSSSSQKSTTSLDRLRDSVNSDGYSSTLATNSACGSIPSSSPTCANIPSIATVTDSGRDRLYLRSYSYNSGLELQTRRSSPPRASILERRKLSVHSLTIGDQEQPRARKVFLDLPSTISASPNDGSPQPGDIAVSGTSEDSDPKPTTDTRERQSSKNSDQISRESTSLPPTNISAADRPNSAPKAKYSLFPVRPVAESKPEPIANPIPSEQPVPRLSPPKHVKTESKIEKSEPRHKKSRSRTVTLELRQHRVSALLTAGEFDLPQRSPAVTDDMIMSNFGVADKGPPLSPMPEIKVPGLADLKIDLDFLKAPYATHSRKLSAWQDARRGSRTKSVSSVHSEGAMSFSKAPVGPPPITPLPAVPQHERQISRGQRISQHSRQSSARKVGDTTSMQFDAGQKVISDTPSFSLSPQQMQTTQKPSEPHLSKHHHHRRTISGSHDGPPPPSRVSSKGAESKKNRSRSRSRPRRKSSKQPV